jgi:hypothetical protein
VVQSRRVATAMPTCSNMAAGTLRARPRPSRAYWAWYVPAAVSGRHPPSAVEDILLVVVLLPPSGSNPLTSFDSQVMRWTCYMSTSSRMLGQRCRKVDCTGGLTAG